MDPADSGFGKAYKQAVKERYPAFLTFSPYGEKTPDVAELISIWIP